MNQRDLVLLVAACTDAILILQNEGASENLISEYKELRGKLQSMQELPQPTRCEDSHA